MRFHQMWQLVYVQVDDVIVKQPLVIYYVYKTYGELSRKCSLVSHATPVCFLHYVCSRLDGLN